MKKGDVFRKDWPMDWLLVLRPMLPDSPGFDGGLPGVVCRSSVYSRGSFRWGRRWFIPGNPTENKYLRPCNERPTEAWAAELWDSAKRIAKRNATP